MIGRSTFLSTGREVEQKIMEQYRTAYMADGT
jgi:hypothetical protein